MPSFQTVDGPTSVASRREASPSAASLVPHLKPIRQKSQARIMPPSTSHIPLGCLLARYSASSFSLVSRLFFDRSVSARTAGLLALTEPPEAMEPIVLRAQGQDDAQPQAPA